MGGRRGEGGSLPVPGCELDGGVEFGVGDLEEAVEGSVHAR